MASDSTRQRRPLNAFALGAQRMNFFGRNIRRSIWVARCALLLGGLILIVTGWQALGAGRLHYPNYWGGSVFAPFAIAVGALALVVLLVKWRTLTEAPRKLKGKAARRAGRAAASRPPVETFDKPRNP